MKENNIYKKLMEFNGKKICIEENGCIIARFCINDLTFSKENDLLYLKDRAGENNITLNTNQIYKTEILDNMILIYLDNDINIRFSIAS